METGDVPEAQAVPDGGPREQPDTYDLLGALEAEVAAGVVVPVGGQVALDLARMGQLTARLRGATARAAAEDQGARDAARREAEAQAALIREEARREAEMLLDGTRVDRLRHEEADAIIAERRRQGEALVAEAYDYGQRSMAEVLGRAEAARRQVAQARDAVEPRPGLGRRVAGTARQIAGGRAGRSLLGRLFRG